MIRVFLCLYRHNQAAVLKKYDGAIVAWVVRKNFHLAADIFTECGANPSVFVPVESGANDACMVSRRAYLSDSRFACSMAIERVSGQLNWSNCRVAVSSN